MKERRRGAGTVGKTGVWTGVKSLVMLTAAGLINAFGVTVFLMPVKLYDSGISGTSMLLSQLTPEWMSLSLFLVALNVPLFF